MGKYLIGAVVGAIVAVGVLATIWFTTRDTGPNDATRTGCQLVVAALGQADRDSAQAMIDDALDNFDESNIAELRDAAGDVRFAATADNDMLGRSGMAVIDAKCRENFADGWNE